MSTICPRLATLTALTLRTLTVAASAQTAPGILDTLQLERLVASAVPADHQRVSDHFRTLADRYVAAAVEHERMASSYARNPVAKLGTDMAAHCRTLARIDRDLASQLRQLATDHQHMSTGMRDPGAAAASPLLYTGAPAPTDADLQRLAATAEKPADHAALGRHFSELQAAYTRQAAEHGRLALYYTGIKARTDAAHCERLAALARDGADAAASAAMRHQRMAHAPGKAVSTAPVTVATEPPSLADPDDHLAVAATFRAAQARASADAKEHGRLARYYRIWKLFGEAAHCEREAATAAEAGTEAANAAWAHEEAARSNR